MKSKTGRQGGALVIALLTLMIVMLMSGAVLRSIVTAHRQARQTAATLQASWLAESATELARVQLRSDEKYSGETWEVELPDESGQPGKASATITITNHPENGRQITIIAEYAGIRLERTIEHKSLKPDP